MGGFSSSLNADSRGLYKDGGPLHGVANQPAPQGGLQRMPPPHPVRSLAVAGRYDIQAKKKPDASPKCTMDIINSSSPFLSPSYRTLPSRSESIRAEFLPPPPSPQLADSPTPPHHTTPQHNTNTLHHLTQLSINSPKLLPRL
jgi:hypothetical protein